MKVMQHVIIFLQSPLYIMHVICYHCDYDDDDNPHPDDISTSHRSTYDSTLSLDYTDKDQQLYISACNIYLYMAIYHKKRTGTCHLRSLYQGSQAQANGLHRCFHMYHMIRSSYLYLYHIYIYTYNIPGIKVLQVF